jgi:uncharacterized protein (TIGR02598 family)
MKSMKMHSASSAGTRGFSLVEVVLAIGVATFALVSVLGLLNIAVQSDSSASHDTTVAAMSGHVLNELRTVPFDALWAEDPQGARDAAPSIAVPASSTFYFTNEGAPVAAAAVNGNFEVLYKCVVTKTPDEVTRSVGTGFCNQLKLQLEFTWPVTAAANSPKAGTKSLYASIARR